LQNVLSSPFVVYFPKFRQSITFWHTLYTVYSYFLGHNALLYANRAVLRLNGKS